MKPVKFSQVKHKFVNDERKDTHLAVKYMKLAYPKLLYHYDYGADAVLSPRQAGEQKKLQKRRGFPELHIFEGRRGYVGFIVDLKRSNVRIFKKNGMFSSQHIEEQAEWMEDFRQRGYLCKFLKGFDSFKTWLDWYMKGEKTIIKIPEQ